MKVENKDVKIGEHCWAIINKELLIVLKKDDYLYYACGDWECPFEDKELELISIIDKPVQYKDANLYYVDEGDEGE
jgi:hypothetical protein